jgi:hypothetical protein
MKKQIIVLSYIFSLLFIANATFATTVSCNQIGGTTYCSDGTKYNQIGDTIYGNDGSTYNKFGDTVYINTPSNNTNNSANSLTEYYKQQTQEYNQKVASLKSTYGSSNYSFCNTSADICNGAITDLTDPKNRILCLAHVSSCLERMKNTSSSEIQLVKEFCAGNNTIVSTRSNGSPFCACKTGYAWNQQRTSCVVALINTNSKSCGDINAGWTGFYESNGNYNCSCNTGYTLSSDKKSCIVASAPPVISAKTNDQMCVDNYGPNSIWDGNPKNAQGHFQCSCANGYMWSDQQNKCIVAPIVPAKTNNELCTDNYGLNSLWNGTKNDTGGLVCDCKSGYQWNDARTSCVATPIVPEKSQDQICKDAYGLNSVGNSASTDGFYCSCKSGYQWDKESWGRQCIPTPTKTNDQVCQDNYGLSSKWDGTKNDSGGLNCDCKTGYQFNQGQTQCVSVPVTKISNESKVTTSDITSTTSKGSVQNVEDWKDPAHWSNKNATNTEVVKPKSFWKKIKGWFGFK